MRNRWLLIFALLLVVGCKEPTPKSGGAASTGSSSTAVAKAEPNPGPSIGQMAPEIEGADLNDVAFKLSDYKGKVVVLDFWGDW